MSRFASICAGLLMVSSLSGCCLFGHGCGSGCAPSMGGGYYGGGSPCQSGACGAVAPGYPSAYNPAIPQSVAGYAPQAAPQMVMLDTLPTH